MSDALPEGYVVHLPPPRTQPPKPHDLLPSKTILPEFSVSGHEQHERTCKMCGAVRVTIIGGDFSRAWRLRDSTTQLMAEPRCKVAA